MDSTWQRQLMRGNVDSFNVFACLSLSSVDGNKNTCTMAPWHHREVNSICKREFQVRKEFETKRGNSWKREVGTTKNHDRCADIASYMYLPNENTLAYYINKPAMRLCQRLCSSKVFFCFSSVLAVCRAMCSMHSTLTGLYAHKFLLAIKPNRKKFVSHKWFSCNHFALHQRKTSLDLLQ